MESAVQTPETGNPGSGSWHRDAFQLAAIFLCYLAATQLGLYFVARPENVATIWPPSGIALAALLLVDRRLRLPALAAIFTSNTIGNLLGDNSLAISLAFGLANSAEAALGALVLFHFFGPRIRLHRLEEVAGLCLVALAINSLTAMAGAAIPALAFGAPYWQTWLVWLVADGLGILLLTPAIVWWATQTSLSLAAPARLLEGSLLAGLLLLVTFLVFQQPQTERFYILHDYKIFPLLIWAGVRFDRRVTATLLLGMAGIAIATTLQSNGNILPAADRTAHLLTVQFFLAIAATTTMLLAIAVTERREFIARLKNSEEQYRELVENTNDLISKVDSRGYFLYVNPAAERVLGLPPQACIGLSAFSFIHPDDRHYTQETFDRFLATGTTTGTFENRQVSRDGTVSHIIWTARFHRDQTGDVRFVTGIGRDITARKQEETAREALIAELQTALAEIKTLHGIIPICAYCKKIRNDIGYWDQVEQYISQHSNAVFSHGVCPTCYDKQMQTVDEEKA